MPGSSKRNPGKIFPRSKIIAGNVWTARKKLNNTDIYKRGYGRKIFNLINTAYSPLFGYTELSEKQIDLYIDKYLPLIDKKMVPVIENEDGELIGVTITMGSLSHAMQKAKGSLFPFGWYHILRSLKWKEKKKRNCF